MERKKVTLWWVKQRESSDHVEIRRVGGVKGRWERKEHQSFPAACWHTHGRQGYDPSGFHFLSFLFYPATYIQTLFLRISLPLVSHFSYFSCRHPVYWMMYICVVITLWITPAQAAVDNPPPPLHSLASVVPPRIQHMAITRPSKICDSYNKCIESIYKNN